MSAMPTLKRGPGTALAVAISTLSNIGKSGSKLPNQEGQKPLNKGPLQPKEPPPGEEREHYSDSCHRQAYERDDHVIQALRPQWV